MVTGGYTNYYYTDSVGKKNSIDGNSEDIHTQWRKHSTSDYITQ